MNSVGKEGIEDTREAEWQLVEMGQKEMGWGQAMP